MKCLEVKINGERACIAGIGDDGVLTGIVSFVRSRATDETTNSQNKNYSESLDLRVGGLVNRPPGVSEHVEWVHRDLVVGDEILIRIIEASDCDEPQGKKVTYMDCSFCCKKQVEVQTLIAGPGVYICNECVKACFNALANSEPAGNITTVIDKTADAQCSFCGQKPEEVVGMVGVPNARICNQCIKICEDILADRV